MDSNVKECSNLEYVSVIGLVVDDEAVRLFPRRTNDEYLQDEYLQHFEVRADDHPIAILMEYFEKLRLHDNFVATIFLVLWRLFENPITVVEGCQACILFSRLKRDL